MLFAAAGLQAQLSYRTSWLGNTFGGPDKWVQCNVSAMYVSSDGTVFTDSYWDESGREAGIYKDGDAVINPGYTHGWGNFGGKAVAANSTYLYIGTRMDSQNGSLVDANTWPPNGTYWYGISRRPVSNPNSAAPFTGGKGGSGGTLNSSFLVVNTVPQGTDASIGGMVADSTRLYVSNPYANEIRVYDANSMALISKFPVTNPGPLVLDRKGTLWVVQSVTGTTGRVLHYSTSGTQLPEQVAGATNPSALAIDTQGRLMVADAGSARQILTYDISSTPTQISTFPAAFGLPIGVGMDSAGNIYIASNMAGSDIRKYSPNGQLIWRVLGLTFDETAVADPASDGVDVYTQSEHYVMDYSQSNGQEQNYKSPTIDPLKYPTDPRLSFPNERISPVQVRTIQGRKYLFMGASQNFVVYRLQNETAVPSLMFAVKDIGSAVPGFQPPKGHWMWRDLNGDGNIQNNEFLDADGGYDFDVWGWEVDINGDIWRAGESSGLWRFPLQGVDSYGNLIYSRASGIPYGTPAIFTQLERVRYIAETDTMYLSGYTLQNPKTGSEWGCAGREVARYDNWSSGNRTPRWRVVLPYPDPNNYGYVKSWAVAGQRLFAGMLNSQGLAETASAHNLYVYDTSNGAALGEMLPGTEVGRSIGWLDITDALSAFQRSNGEYLIFMEEVAWEKVVMYRMGGTTTPPSVTVTAPAAGATVSGTVTLSATASSTAGLAGVQFQIDGVNFGNQLTAAPYNNAWDTTKVSNGSHQVSAVARDTVGAVTTSNPVTVTVSNSAVPPPAAATYRINAGGGAYTDPQTQQVWGADQYFTGGTTYSSTSSISGTSTPLLYQSERYGSTFQYLFPVPAGNYSVKLKFAEIYYSSAGQRVFNVAINGNGVLSNFDIIAQAGGKNIAIDKSFAVAALNGQIAIAFSSVVDNAKIDAIEILPAASTVAVAISPASVTLNAGQTQQFNASVTGTSNTGLTWTINPNVGTISTSGLYTAPASVTAAQVITITATSLADTSKTATATVTLAATAVPKPIRVNAGGPAYTDPQNQVWAADTGYSGTVYTYSTTQGITGTTTPALYQTERYGAPMQYQFSVPNGTYAVTLKFAELYWTQAGQRVFNVAINGQTLLSNFDIVAQAGGPRIAVDRTFVVQVTGGQVTIQFSALVDKPKISAIAILPASSVVRVNAGGPAYTEPSGRVWSADTGFTGGSTYQVSSAITGTTTSTLYQTERYGANFQYQFAVPNGNAIVVLKFAENYWSQPGQRVFNASINSVSALAKFDIVAQSGGAHIAADRAIPVAVSNGQVNISFTSVVDNALVDAIEILTTP